MTIYLAPRHTPSFSQLVDNLGRPKPAELAHLLGVSERTVRNWQKRDEAPRAVLLALYWLSSWGQCDVDADLYNRAQNHQGLADCLKREVDALRRELARVLAVAQFDSANAPTMVDLHGIKAPEPPAPVLQLVRA